MKQKELMDLLYADIILDIPESNEEKINMEQLKILTDNGLAKVFKFDEELTTVCYYHIAISFLAKYNKDIAKIVKKEKMKIAHDSSNDKKVNHLLSLQLPEGRYIAKLNKKNYLLLIINQLTVYSDFSATVTGSMYIIGKKCGQYYTEFLRYAKSIMDYVDSVSNLRNIFHFGKDDRSLFPSSSYFKSFDSIIMHDKEKILSYVDNWYDKIPFYYEKYGILPKLSILLYGTPGTGKSSFYKALSMYLNINNILSIQSVEDISKLNARHGMVVIDELDLICGNRENVEENWKLKMFLDMLDNPPTFKITMKDGSIYPCSIIVATTNNYDKLDPAIKRYGRFDLQIEMKDFDRDMAEEMCDLYDLSLSDVVKEPIGKNFTIQPAKLQALCLENLDADMKRE